MCLLICQRRLCLHCNELCPITGGNDIWHMFINPKYCVIILILFILFKTLNYLKLEICTKQTLFTELKKYEPEKNMSRSYGLSFEVGPFSTKNSYIKHLGVFFLLFLREFLPFFRKYEYYMSTCEFYIIKPKKV